MPHGMPSIERLRLNGNGNGIRRTRRESRPSRETIAYVLVCSYPPKRRRPERPLPPKDAVSIGSVRSTKPIGKSTMPGERPPLLRRLLPEGW